MYQPVFPRPQLLVAVVVATCSALICPANALVNITDSFASSNSSGSGVAGQFSPGASSSPGLVTVPACLIGFNTVLTADAVVVTFNSCSVTVTNVTSATTTAVMIAIQPPFNLNNTLWFPIATGPLADGASTPWPSARRASACVGSVVPFAATGGGATLKLIPSTSSNVLTPINGTSGWQVVNVARNALTNVSTVSFSGRLVIFNASLVFNASDLSMNLITLVFSVTAVFVNGTLDAAIDSLCDASAPARVSWGALDLGLPLANVAQVASACVAGVPNAVTGACDSCLTGFAGSTCSDCDPYHYGARCVACLCNQSLGICDSGTSGTGLCQACNIDAHTGTTAYAGVLCNISCPASCPSGYACRDGVAGDGLCSATTPAPPASIASTPSPPQVEAINFISIVMALSIDTFNSTAFRGTIASVAGALVKPDNVVLDSVKSGSVIVLMRLTGLNAVALQAAYSAIVSAIQSSDAALRSLSITFFSTTTDLGAGVTGTPSPPTTKVATNAPEVTTAAPPPAPVNKPASPTSTLSDSAVIGIIVGAVAFVVVVPSAVGLTIYYCYRKDQKLKQEARNKYIAAPSAQAPGPTVAVPADGAHPPEAANDNYSDAGEEMVDSAPEVERAVVAKNRRQFFGDDSDDNDGDDLELTRGTSVSESFATTGRQHSKQHEVVASRNKIAATAAKLKTPAKPESLANLKYISESIENDDIEFTLQRLRSMEARYEQPAAAAAPVEATALSETPPPADAVPEKPPQERPRDQRQVKPKLCKWCGADELGAALDVCPVKNVLHSELRRARQAAKYAEVNGEETV